ncbi:hypothetical protein EMCRGX_G008453 [Ephydatia muelleri]
MIISRIVVVTSSLHEAVYSFPSNHSSPLQLFIESQVNETVTPGLPSTNRSTLLNVSGTLQSVTPVVAVEAETTGVYTRTDVTSRCSVWCGHEAIGSWTNFQMMADRPLNMATRYFTFPDDIIPVWTVLPRQTHKLFSYHYSLESYQGGLERHLLKEGKCFETLLHNPNDTGAVRSLLAGPGSVNAFTTFVKTRVTCSSSTGFGPVGSAVCVFNYATMANVFQTSSFVVRDTSTLVFNSVTGAPVDSQLCQYNLHLSTLNIVINRTVGLGTYTLDTFVTFSSNYSSPSCQSKCELLTRLDGKVVEGMDVVRKMEAVGSEDGDTSKPVVIKDCGMAKYWHSSAAYAIASEVECGGKDSIPSQGHEVYRWPRDLFKPGMYDDPEDQSLCVVEHKAIKSLCQGLVQQCCYTSRPSWELESFMKAPQIFVN